MTLLDETSPRSRSVPWTVDARRSRLELDIRACGLVSVRGRFTRVRGQVVLGRDPREHSVSVAVEVASLTAGHLYRDALLAGAGIIDPAAGPVITYRSHAVVEDPHGGWRLDGTVGTARCRLPLRLEADEAPAPTSTGLRIRARGRMTREQIVELLARPGAGALLGPHAQLDLTLAVFPARSGHERPAGRRVGAVR